MKLKPLLLLIPLVIILAAVIILDTPVTESAKAPAGKSKTESEHQEDKEPIELKLVIGHTGTMDDEKGEPIYAAPDLSSERLGGIQYNCCVLEADEDTAAEEYDQETWLCVDLPNMNREGYVQKANVDQKTLRIEYHDPIRYEIVKNALSYMGLKFVRYGKSLEEGIDCSNFIKQIYGMSNINIPDTPNGMKSEAKSISRDDALAGDILYYNVNDGEGHVSIYLGDEFQIGAMGHAGKTYPEGGVRICMLEYKDRPMPEFMSMLD